MNVDSQLRNFSKNIRYLRKRYHFTQAEMAKTLGISILPLQKMESGKNLSSPRLETLVNAAQHFGIAPSRLLESELEKN